jgi:hypothetical protein
MTNLQRGPSGAKLRPVRILQILPAAATSPLPAQSFNTQDCRSDFFRLRGKLYAYYSRTPLATAGAKSLDDGDLERLLARRRASGSRTSSAISACRMRTSIAASSVTADASIWSGA